MIAGNTAAAGSPRHPGPSTMNQNRPYISVVLPAYNEEQNLANMAAGLALVVGPLGNWEIVFVDDCSADGTLAVIKAPPAPSQRYSSGA